jgi:hypothetical protein
MASPAVPYMKMRSLFHLTATVIICTGIIPRLHAQDTNAPAHPPTREEIRQQLQGLTPEERRAKLNELRAKYGRLDSQATSNPFDKLSSTNTTPPQPTSLQASNLARLRARGAQLTPDQNRARMTARIDELRKKKEAGTLTVPEKRLLDAWDLRLKSTHGTNTNATPPEPDSSTPTPAKAAPQ